MTKTRNSAPALRFKDEHGNDYPDWEQNKLGNIGTTFNGLTGKNSTHFGKGKPYIQYLQVFENSRIDIDEFGFVEIGENESQNKVCSGDVFFTTSSETPNEVGTASVLIDEVKNTYLNSFCFGYRVNKEYLLPEYARFAFRASSFRKKLVPLAQGSTRYNLSKTSLMKIITKLPSIKEQQIIALFLSSVDTKIEQLGKKKGLLEQYKKGVMQKLFNQDVRFKDEQGNYYPDWEEKKLGEIGKVVTGKTPSTMNKSLWSGEIQFITPSDINDDNKYQISTERYIKQTKDIRVLPLKSIIYTCIASIGKICISVKPCATNQQINALTPSNSYDSEFIYYSLLNLTPRIKATQATTTLPIINKTEFKKINMSIPSLSEQQKIAAFLAAIDKKIELVAARFKQAQNFKEGLLQKMFV